MTTDQLKQLKNLPIEIKDLIARKRELQEELTMLQQQSVTDTVSGSDAAFPYTQHTIQISGIVSASDAPTLQKKRSAIHALQTELDAQHLVLLTRERQFYQFLQQEIPDYIDRKIFRMHYLGGLTFREIAKLLEKEGVWLSESGVKSRVYRRISLKSC